VREGLAEAGIVVAELAFRDGEVLAGGVGLLLVTAAQAVQGVQRGFRARHAEHRRQLRIDRRCPTPREVSERRARRMLV